MNAQLVRISCEVLNSWEIGASPNGVNVRLIRSVTITFWRIGV